jgi:hypothetical protein
MEEAEKRKFRKRTYPIGGFDVSIAGVGCSEEEIWIEQVGDRLLILVGAAAERRRAGLSDESISLATAGVVRPPDGTVPRGRHISSADAHVQPWEPPAVVDETTSPDHVAEAAARAKSRALVQKNALRFRVDTGAGEETVDLSTAVRKEAKG